MDVAVYQSKVYSAQPCWELVADIYSTELDEVSVAYKTVNRSVREMASAFRIAVHKSAHGFSKVVTPVDMCVVLLGSNKLGIHHCGVFYDGKVLHALPGGTLYEDLTTIIDRFDLVEFWARA